jgi:hypothetical protein
MSSNKSVFQRFLENQDLFGYKVRLNFEGKSGKKGGGLHNTTIGGITSILIKILVLLFIINRIIVLVDASNNGTYDFISTINGFKKEVDDIDEIPAFIVFQVLEKNGQVLSPVRKPNDLQINAYDVFTSSFISRKT